MGVAICERPSQLSGKAFYSPGEVAELLSLDVNKVLAWVNSGELVASNCAVRQDGQRPRWRIAADDLAAFLRRRQPQQPEEKPRRRRKSAEKYVPKYL